MAKILDRLVKAPLSRMLDWWRVYIGGSPLLPTSPRATLPLPPYLPLAPAPALPRPAIPTSTDEVGEFYFKGTILDQLDYYFGLLKRMRKTDRQNYEMLRSVGAHIIPDRNIEHVIREPSPWWQTNRPAFGAVAFGDLSRTTRLEEEYEASEESKRLQKSLWYPKLVLFSKYKAELAPVELARAGKGFDVYKLTVYWDRASKEYQAPQSFGIALTAAGIGRPMEMRILPMLVREQVEARGTTGRNRGKLFHIPHTHWGFDESTIEWGKRHDLKPEEIIGEVFIESLNAFEQAHYSMIRIDVEKNGLRGAFGVSMTRTPYFFKDRDVTVTASGVKAPIFHVVRGHVRTSGSKVRTHFRGLRNFTWNGYRISITVPIREHIDFTEFDVAAGDGEAMRRKGFKTKDLIRPADLAAAWRKDVEERRGGVVTGGKPLALLDALSKEKRTSE